MPLGADLAEHAAPGRALHGSPQLGVDRLEQVERLGVPGPAQVVDELAELVAAARGARRGRSSRRRAFTRSHASSPVRASGIAPPALVSVRAYDRTASRRSTWVGWNVVGRFGLSDIRPVVGSTSSGEFPRTAPWSASRSRSRRVVFREGHDAVGANVVVRDPTGRRPRRSAWTPGAPGTDRWHADVVARPRRAGGRSPSRRGATRSSTWHHAVTVKIDAGQGTEDLANDLEDGARLFDRLAKSLPKDERRARVRGRRRRCATPRSTSRTGSRPRSTSTCRQLVARRTRCATWSPPRRATRCGSTATRALFGAWYEFFPRSIGAELAGDPTAPARPSGTARSRTRVEHLDYVAVHGLRRRVPPADPPDRRGEPQGPEQHPRRRELGRRLAVGDRLARGRPRRDPPAARHDGRLPRRSSKRAKRTRHGGRARPRAAVRARPPVGRPSTRSGSPPGPTARSPTPRTRRRSTRTSTRSTSTTTPRASTPSACASCGTGSTPACTIFRVDNPHTKPINFWQWLIGEVRKTDPDVLFLAEAFTRPAMMHELAKVGFHQSYTYFTWRNDEGGARGVRAASCVEPAHYMRPNFFANTPGHPQRVPACTAGRPRSRSARCSPR